MIVTNPNEVSTRLILTNLSPSLTAPLLRQHLSQCPPNPPSLTDCKVLFKPDGTSRRIAFVGFKDSTEADRVRKWADGTWVQGEKGGSRVKVDWAKETADLPPPRKRARPSHQTSSSSTPASNATTQPTKTSNSTSKDDLDSRFAEFMSVMAPKKRTKNDVDPELGAFPSVQSVQVAKISEGVAEPSKKKEEVVKEVQKEKEEVMELEKAKESEGRAVDSIADDETISDLEYMQRRMRRSLEEEQTEEDKMFEQSEDEDDTATEAKKDAPGWVQDDSELPPTSTSLPIPSTSEDPSSTLSLSHPRLFLRNLAYSSLPSSRQSLTSLLSPFGPLSALQIPLDPSTKLTKGIAYATFERIEDAEKAMGELDGRTWEGRLVHVMEAARRGGEGDGNEGTGDRGENVKGKKMENRKKESDKGISWATLYMNTDAVLNSVAAKLNIEKSVLLDPTNDNAAVRVALAESHVIQETKRYFESEGVDLEKLSKPSSRRSGTIILVKNIPYATSSSTLNSLFSPFGAVGRMLIPPSGTMAIVEMEDEDGASKAWRGLNFKKLGKEIIYLEKGPRGLLDGERKKAVTEKDEGKVATAEKGGEKEKEGKDEEAASTLFIKNLSFNTTTSSLTSTFSSFPSFLFARVQTKPDPKKPGATLSMGFGFVGFRDVAGAQKALEGRQGYMLEGHKLEIKFAMRGREDSGVAKNAGTKDGKKKKEGTSTKLIVKNLPFEVTRKEVRDLFSSYGTLKSVRLPRKFDHKTRGFAFLDFLTRRDAEAAFEALEHTHLLGRHLVIQWAAEEEGEDGVEGLRKKAGRDLEGLGMGEGQKKSLGKKRKFQMGDGGDEGETMVLDD